MDFVVFLSVNWHQCGAHNRQQIMSRLARQNRVIFVEPQHTFAGKAPARRNPSASLPTNLKVVKPLIALPFGSNFLPETLIRFLSPFVMEINTAKLAQFLKAYLAPRQSPAPILWLYDPLHVGLVGKLGEKLVVYHAHDDTSIFPFNHKIRRLISKSRQQLLAKADLVFECSFTRFETEKESYSNFFYVPNGGEVLHFQKTLDPATVIPGDLDAIPRPIIGYYGSIDFRLDLDLLRYVARAHREWSILLVGSDRLGYYNRNLDLSSLNNIHILGPRAYQILPNYLKAFDVVIWPYISYWIDVYRLNATQALRMSRSWKTPGHGRPTNTVSRTRGNPNRSHP